MGVETLNHRTYLGDVLVLLFIERSICAIGAYSDLFLVCNLHNSVQKIMPHIPDLNLKFMASVDIGDLWLLGY